LKWCFSKKHVVDIMRRIGAVAVLAKPFTQEELLENMATALKEV
jgi:hypothetical protein